MSYWRNSFISLGKARVDVLLNEANEAISYLETNPVTTDDYVAYINFVDQAQHKVDKMETELEYVKEIYNIMEEYQIPVPAMDAANYLVNNFSNTSIFIFQKIVQLIFSLMTHFFLFINFYYKFFKFI